MNVEVYDKNVEMKEYINIVPTSAITGEGIPDLLGLLLFMSQKFLRKKLEYKEELSCSVLEVKILENVGTTVDVILVNGELRVGDKILIGGLSGPIEAEIKNIMTPHPLKEIRAKTGEFLYHQSIKGAMGIKLMATGLDEALAGSQLYVYKTKEEKENYKQLLTSDFNSIVKSYISKSGRGVLVQASTLGSLEAILVFLNSEKVDVAAVGIGKLQKKDIIKIKTLYEISQNQQKEQLCILAFDIEIHPDIKKFAEEHKVQLYFADIIYHLFDSFKAFQKECELERIKEKMKSAIFPCCLKIITAFNKKDPLIIGLDVISGILKIGAPIVIPGKKIKIGIVDSIQKDKKDVNNIRFKDGSVAVRFKDTDNNVAFGRHFDEQDLLYSNVFK
jgi:translation initiation factor 5B